MTKAVNVVEAKTPEHPRVLFFVRNGTQAKAQQGFHEDSGRVAKLEIIPVPDAAEGAHWLRRLSAEGLPVWQIRHPSLKETFLHAEWEYEIKQEQGQKV